MYQKIIALEKEKQGLQFALDQITQTLEEVENELRVIGEHSRDIIARLEINGNIKWLSKSISSLGYANSELLQKNITDYIHPEDVDRITYIIKSTMEFGNYTDNCIQHLIEFRLKDKDTNWHWVESSLSIKFNNGSNPVCLMVARDITERKINDEKIKEMAYKDALTGLPNRTLLMDRLKIDIAHATRAGKDVAVLFLDLDGFKEINDNYGHKCGDSFLKIIAKRLQMAVREDDTVARIGGDEFVIVLYDIYNGNIDIIIKKILDVITKKVRFGEISVSCTASVGVDTLQTHGSDPMILINNADAAMYRSKKTGKNRYTYYSDNLELFDIDTLKEENYNGK